MSKNRNIFEEKRINGIDYIGQKPVAVPMVREDLRDASWGIIDHTREQDASVRHVPNAGDIA